MDDVGRRLRRGPVPTCRWLARLSRAGYDPNPGPHLRRHSRPSWPAAGDSLVGKLGRAEDENPLAGQHLALANSNFAEVGDGPTNLILSGIKTVRQKP